MKTVVNTEGNLATMESRGVHQPWLGALGSIAWSPESLASELYLPAAVARFKRPQPGERLWDVALALLFVAICAATGWVGAVLL